MKHLSSKLPRALILSPLAEQPTLSTKYLSWAAVYGRNILIDNDNHHVTFHFKKKFLLRKVGVRMKSCKTTQYNISKTNTITLMPC
jgi:CRISPR/Cas system-associated endonuclease Cas1